MLLARQHVLGPLRVDPSRYIGFSARLPAGGAEGAAAARAADCARVLRELRAWGDGGAAPLVDVCLLGLGLNCHLGFNEPRTAAAPAVAPPPPPPTTVVVAAGVACDRDGNMVAADAAAAPLSALLAEADELRAALADEAEDAVLARIARHPDITLETTATTTTRSSSLAAAAAAAAAAPAAWVHKARAALPVGEQPLCDPAGAPPHVRVGECFAVNATLTLQQGGTGNTRQVWGRLHRHGAGRGWVRLASAEGVPLTDCSAAAEGEEERAAGDGADAFAVELEASTMQHAMVAGHEACTHGVTMGVAQLARAALPLLLVTGERKQPPLRRTLCEPVSARVPSSHLRRCAGAVCVCDEAACPPATLAAVRLAQQEVGAAAASTEGGGAGGAAVLAQLAMEHAAAVEAKDYGRCAEIDKEIAERQRQRQMETEMGGGLQS
jgi:6-phosphogluconolactonase/glucosamine-6-phosphate isomerase/deaminase